MEPLAALRELRVPIVRWPGGCFVSAYHWKDGVGPQRRPAYDKAWRVEDPNTFGTDEFVSWSARSSRTSPATKSKAGWAHRWNSDICWWRSESMTVT